MISNVNGEAVTAQAVQIGGAGGDGTNGANGGNGAASSLDTAVQGSTSGSLTLIQDARGGAGGSSDTGTPGAGGQPLRASLCSTTARARSRAQ